MSQDEIGTKKGISRRALLKSGAAAGVAAALGGATAGVAAAAAGAGPLATGGEADSGDGKATELVFVNGRIHTMDGSNTIAKSVSIRNGRFVAVGNSVSAGPGVRVINLHGATVVPGIIDNHNHIVLMGNRPGYHTPLENAYSIADVQATYGARAAGIPAGAFITTIGGFHSNQFTELRLPTLAELDAAAPGHPAYITIGFSGPSVTNTLGKAFFEAAALPVTVAANGSIASGTQTGRATLALRQTLLNPATRRQSVLDTMAYAAGLGITTHLDQGAFQATNTPSDGAAHEDNYTMHLPFLGVYAEGKGIIRLRINFLHMETTAGTPQLVERLKNAFPFFGGDMVRTGGIGEFTASGLGPNWLDANRKVAAAGWRSEVHSLSATDFITEIQGFETVNTEFPGIVGQQRWVVAHVPKINQEYVDRQKAMGGGLSLTGWQYLAGNLPTSGVPYAGPPFRLIVDSGVNTGLSSDGMQIAPMNPWLHMYFATTGLNAKHVQINPDQHISRQEALRLYTSDNGWFIREEDQLGSIETGKLADLVVLNDDYFSVSDDDLKKIRSSLTVVGGQIVHDAGIAG